MSASAAAKPALQTAFASLIDYAGLFPPAQLAMQRALAEFHEARGGAQSWMLGRFIVPATRLRELLENAGDASFGLCVIIDAERDPRRWFESVRRTLGAVAQERASQSDIRLEAIEAPLPALERERDTYDAAVGQFAALLDAAGLRDLPAYLEIPRSANFREQMPAAMRVLARYRLGAKVRCGGADAAAFPPPSDLAQFLYCAAGERVQYKATAGLHHPIRHIDAASGFPMHGFLNVLAAAFAAAGGAAPDVMLGMLEEEYPAAFAFDDAGFRWRAWHADLETIETTRRDGFVAYGSCSFSEPVEDLRNLGLL